MTIGPGEVQAEWRKVIIGKNHATGIARQCEWPVGRHAADFNYVAERKHSKARNFDRQVIERYGADRSTSQIRRTTDLADGLSRPQLVHRDDATQPAPRLAMTAVLRNDVAVMVAPSLQQKGDRRVGVVRLLLEEFDRVVEFRHAH